MRADLALLMSRNARFENRGWKRVFAAGISRANVFRLGRTTAPVRRVDKKKLFYEHDSLSGATARA